MSFPNRRAAIYMDESKRTGTLYSAGPKKIADGDSASEEFLICFRDQPAAFVFGDREFERAFDRLGFCLGLKGFWARLSLTASRRKCLWMMRLFAVAIAPPFSVSLAWMCTGRRFVDIARVGSHRRLPGAPFDLGVTRAVSGTTLTLAASLCSANCRAAVPLETLSKCRLR